MDVRKKLTARIYELQGIMESNHPPTELDKAISLKYRISPFWAILSEEDREYVQCAYDAIEQGCEWGQPE